MCSLNAITCVHVLWVWYRKFLHEVQLNSEHNKMTPNNLGTVFGPNILRPSVSASPEDCSACLSQLLCSALCSFMHAPLALLNIPTLPITDALHDHHTVTLMSVLHTASYVRTYIRCTLVGCNRSIYCI